MTESSDAIFLIDKDKKLSRASFQTYASEDLLQKLIADYPEVLAGEQIDPSAPVRWLLVCREAGVPDAEGGYDRFAVDHLLLDQNAIPTFVEVKRSSDTRIRRELVGQMLDYAANALRYWPADRIRELAAQRYKDGSLQDEIIKLTGESPDPATSSEVAEHYWQRVSENLRNGNVRLLFVADSLPPELRRIIEFLNEQMPRLQVLGLELRQYVGDGLHALVPRLIGQTELVRQQKASPSGAKMSQSDLLALCPEPVRTALDRWLQIAAPHLVVSPMPTGLALRAQRSDGRPVTIAYVYPPGPSDAGPKLVPYFGYLRPDEGSEKLRQQLLAMARFREMDKSLELVMTPENQEQLGQVFRALSEAAAGIAIVPAAG